MNDRPAASSASTQPKRSATAAVPNLRDQARSPQPSVSNNVSLIVSLVNSGRVSAVARWRASVVLPDPGAPATTTTSGPGVLLSSVRLIPGGRDLLAAADDEFRSVAGGLTAVRLRVCVRARPLLQFALEDFLIHI